MVWNISAKKYCTSYEYLNTAHTSHSKAIAIQDKVLYET